MSQNENSNIKYQLLNKVSCLISNHKALCVALLMVFIAVAQFIGVWAIWLPIQNHITKYLFIMMIYSTVLLSISLFVGPIIISLSNNNDNDDEDDDDYSEMYIRAFLGYVPYIGNTFMGLVNVALVQSSLIVNLTWGLFIYFFDVAFIVSTVVAIVYGSFSGVKNIRFFYRPLCFLPMPIIRYVIGFVLFFTYKNDYYSYNGAVGIYHIICGTIYYLTLIITMWISAVCFYQ